MVGKDRRLDKLTEVLSAKERAVLVLRAWKEKKVADPAWRLTMPEHQVAEFNRLIRLMNGINFNLGPLLVHLEAQVEMLNLRLGWLATILMWQWCAEQIADYIRLETKEPVTESEYRELERKAREEYKPVSELAELLAERHEDWAEGEIEREEGSHNEVIVTPQAWERVKGEKERELATLVKEGALQGRGKARGLQVQVGSFYDSLDEAVPVEPEWAREYDVRPDEEASAVRVRRRRRDDARKAYRQGPTAPVVHLPDLGMDFGEPSEIDKLVATHKERLRAGIDEHWAKLCAVEQVASEVAQEFGGEDPALPEMRHVLDHCEEKLKELHQETKTYTGPFDLREPAEDEVAWVRQLVEAD